MCNGASGGGSGGCGEKLTSIPVGSSSWAGYLFQSSPPPDGTAGVYVLAKREGGRLVPLFIGEALDMALRLSLQREEAPTLFERVAAVHWLAQSNDRLRRHIEKILIDRFSPSHGGDAGPAADLGELVTDCDSDDRYCLTGVKPAAVKGHQLWSIAPRRAPHPENAPSPGLRS